MIPLESLKGLVELDRLDLGKDSSSSISGTIPGSLATVGNLRDLTLTAKRLSGTLPAELLGADAKGRLEELKAPRDSRERQPREAAERGSRETQPRDTAEM